MVFTGINAAAVFLICSKEVEPRMSPDFGKAVSEDIAEFKFSVVMKQVARENTSVGQNRKLSHPSRATHLWWQ
jgi:hypothetical protein